jgi:hypothetical protein
MMTYVDTTLYTTNALDIMLIQTYMAMEITETIVYNNNTRCSCCGCVWCECD